MQSSLFPVWQLQGYKSPAALGLSSHSEKDSTIPCPGYVFIFFVFFCANLDHSQLFFSFLGFQNLRERSIEGIMIKAKKKKKSLCLVTLFDYLIRRVRRVSCAY